MKIYRISLHYTLLQSRYRNIVTFTVEELWGQTYPIWNQLIHVLLLILIKIWKALQYRTCLQWTKLDQAMESFTLIIIFSLQGDSINKAWNAYPLARSSTWRLKNGKKWRTWKYRDLSPIWWNFRANYMFWGVFQITSIFGPVIARDMI